MRIQDMVCSPEQAHTLYRLGCCHRYRQMLYSWITIADGRSKSWKADCTARLFMDLPIKANAKYKKSALITTQKISYEYCYGTPNTLCMCLAAFTMDQLGVMMGEHCQPCYYDQHQSGWVTGHNAQKAYPTEVQARAEVVIYLLKQEAFTAQEAMRRLFAFPVVNLIDIS